MPEFVLTGTEVTDFLQVQATMLYPEDEDLRHRYFAMRVSEIAEGLDWVGDLPAELTRPLWDAGPRAELEAEALERRKRTEHTGWIVWWIHGMACSGEAGVSKKRAIRERRAFVRPEHRTHGDGSRPTASERQIRYDFDLFHPVAHLWAAHFYFDWEHMLDGSREPNGVDAMLRSLPRFLAIAEAYREFGESWENTRQDQGGSFPLLDSNVTWKVRSEDSPYALPGVKLTYKVR